MRNTLALCLFLILLFSACEPGLVASEYRSTNQGAWSKDQTFSFTFSPEDTVATHHIFINIRNDQKYPYSNLFLIADMVFPGGEQVRDTLEYLMAEPDGTWLGYGRGSIKENKLWYRENIVFPTSGVYTLNISQAMRKTGQVEGDENLEGITDVGFQIIKSTE